MQTLQHKLEILKDADFKRAARPASIYDGAIGWINTLKNHALTPEEQQRICIYTNEINRMYKAAAERRISELKELINLNVNSK